MPSSRDGYVHCPVFRGFSWRIRCERTNAPSQRTSHHSRWSGWGVGPNDQIRSDQVRSDRYPPTTPRASCRAMPCKTGLDSTRQVGSDYMWSRPGHLFPAHSASARHPPHDTSASGNICITFAQKHRQHGLLLLLRFCALCRRQLPAARLQARTPPPTSHARRRPHRLPFPAGRQGRSPSLSASCIQLSDHLPAAVLASPWSAPWPAPASGRPSYVTAVHAAPRTPTGSVTGFGHQVPAPAISLPPHARRRGP